MTSSNERVPTPLTSYQRRLFVFLSVATFFEGFDYMALAQILPSLRAEYGLSESGGGDLVSVIGIGAVVAYLLIRQADIVGRRKILGLTIAGYTVFSALSALAQNAVQFGALQLVARVFLLAEYAVSMVYISEEFPADRRAFAIGVIQGVNSLGAIACAGLVPFLLKTPLGFRSVYLVGAAPLLIVMYLRRGVRETQRFMASPPAQTSLLRIFKTPYKARLPLLASIWALTYMCTYVVVTYWKEFAIKERGFDDKQVSHAIMIAALGSLPLVFGSGKLLDAMGRRRGAIVVFVAASVSTVIAYQAHDFWLLTLGLTGGIFAASAVLPVLNAITLELFPTELRADGYGWANNLLGRTGYIAGPWLVGHAAERFGWGASVSATAILPLLALVLILTRVPETGGKELEETAVMH